MIEPRPSAVLVSSRLAPFRAAFLLLAGFAAPLPASDRPSAIPDIRLEPAFPDLKFEKPLFLAEIPDGSSRIVVLEQGGRAWVFPKRPDAKPGDRKPFLDVSARTSTFIEMGLLGMAFHPRFKENGLVYVYYSEKPSGAGPVIRQHDSIVARFSVDPGDRDRLDPASERVLMRIRQPYANHNGGCLLFGPDGLLYIGLGDGGAGGDPHGHGQDRKTLLGDMLRIDVDRPADGKGYGIPADNPFVGNDKGWRPEIWAWGLRNPWRFSFDRATGDLWAADVGQNKMEEVDLIEKGRNYGWNRYEGTLPFSSPARGRPPEDYAFPVVEYLQKDGGRSITGGYVYRGKGHPGLDGVYFYADYVSGKLWGTRYDRAEKKAVGNRLLLETGLAITSFGEDADGELYVIAFNDKQVYRIEPATSSRTR